MGAQRDQMLKIIEFCSEERTAEEIDAVLAPLREFRRSVFSPINMRSMLLKAGALEYRDNDEAPEEELDGDGSLVLPEPARATWISTVEALEYLEGLDPFADLAHALDAIADRQTCLAVLDHCAQQPRSLGDISGFISQNTPDGTDAPDAGGLVGRLEEAGALIWEGAWVTSPMGRDYLGLNG